ncbi:CSEP0257 putative effector protein [Blumeria hordei DH14]|uniref:CSEP0257 putative effector protein n=1 Tax=Blumeria graminis f. sp. hordei (strain DH14) TaxID=546991 RepID=N1JJB3_BLUG1|nr:CSEP0257 putative effector protein [Blumeria hordei DH14]
MRSNRLLNSLGIWLVSTIAAVQCFGDYSCSNDMVISRREIDAAHNKANSYINNAASQRMYLSKIVYNGNLNSESDSMYYWFITQFKADQRNVTTTYYLLTSTTGEFLGVISTGDYQDIGTSDTWCSPY